jgi:hypothetical protein
MFWLLLPIILLIVLLRIGVAIRGQSLNVRIAVFVIVPLVLLMAVLVVGSLTSLEIYKFYACTVSCGSSTTNVLSADFEAQKWQYILVLSLPPILRPSCDTLPDLCLIERSYDLFNAGIGISMFVALGAFFALFLSSRNPAPSILGPIG